MRTAGRCLVVGWLLAALVVLGMDGRLPAFLGWAALGSLLVVGVDALVRWHRRPSAYCRPAVPERYRVADDLAEPVAVVVAVAERDAEVDPACPGR
jgi:hypothetical protein